MDSAHPNITLRKNRIPLASKENIKSFPSHKNKRKRIKIDLDLNLRAAKQISHLVLKTPNSLPEPRCDVKSKSDPLLYVNATFHIFRQLKKTELKYLPPKNFLARQKHIDFKMRRILVNWIVEIHEKMDLCSESLFLAINLVDRFVFAKGENGEDVERKELQLIGTTSLFLASKYEDRNPMSVRDLIYLSKHSFGKKDVFEMERIIMNRLDFCLTLPYSLTFARRYLRVHNATRFERRYCEYILELCLLDVDMVTIPPSKLAASAVFLVLKFNSPFIETEWKRLLLPHTGYEYADLKPIAAKLISLVQKLSDKSVAVHRKFSRERYGKVAAVPIKSLMRIGIRKSGQYNNNN